MPEFVNPSILPIVVDGGIHHHLLYWPLARPHIENAYQVSEHVIRVEFSADVKQIDDLAANDALNPENWSVVDYLGEDAAVLTVVSVSSDTVDVRLVRAPAPRFWNSTITASLSIVEAVTLLSISIPNTFVVPGIAPAINRFLEAQAKVMPFRDLADGIFGSTARAIPVGDDGDYVLAPTQDTIRKMVLRILSTVVGEFAFNPGFGAAPRIKSLARQSAVENIVASAKRQILALPWISDTVITVTAGDEGITRIHAKVLTAKLGNLSVDWEKD